MQDIPVLAASAAEKHPGVSYIVTAPIGLHELMVVRLHSWKLLKTRNTCVGNLPLLILEFLCTRSNLVSCWIMILPWVA